MRSFSIALACVAGLMFGGHHGVIASNGEAAAAAAPQQQQQQPEAVPQSFTFKPPVFLPLYTSGSRIVDSFGSTVRLTCTNWPSHMQSLLPEGLQHAPITQIASLVSQLGYNCVRYTYAIDFAAHPETQSLTVAQRLAQVGLADAHLSAITQHNPQLVNKTLLQVFDVAMKTLRSQNLMVLLDNHVTHADWCCSGSDGNGWFNMGYFNTSEWIDGLGFIASHTLLRHPNVVAMSMRNEVRAPKSVPYGDRVSAWLTYMSKAVSRVLDKNPFLLTFAGGIDYANDLSYINETSNLQLFVERTHPILAHTKIVYEAHWYSWSGYAPTDNCTDITNAIHNKWGFINDPINKRAKFYAPLAITEIGDGMDNFPATGDNYYNCVKSYIQAQQSSFATWVLPGCYYIRDNVYNSHESFGLLDDNFSVIKSQTFQNFIKPALAPQYFLI